MERIDFGKKRGKSGDLETLDEVAEHFFNYLEKKKWRSELRERFDNVPLGNQFSAIRNVLDSETEFKKLIVSRPAILQANFIDAWKVIDTNTKVVKGKKTGSISQKMLGAWGYERFRKSFAYDFYSSHLDIPVCPYCNRSYTTTLRKKKGGKLLFHFDHFFSKAKYPYLSMSFFNLVPSCGVCNSSLKGQDEFTLESHCHPFEHNFHKALTFFIVPRKQGGNAQTLKLRPTVDLTPQKEALPIDLKRAYSNAETFELVKLYESHSDQIERMEILRASHPPAYFQTMVHNFPQIYNNENDAKRAIFGVPLEEGQLHKHSLGKLTFDLYEQLWNK